MSSAAVNRTPASHREMAVAGIVFSLLMIIGLAIIHLALPDVQETTDMPNAGFERALPFALHIVPFAGIAFLWLLGVLRSRLGSTEDYFFPTVFLASGLLFVASLFAAGAVAEAVLLNRAESAHQVSSDVYYFAREASSSFLNVFAIKMAGVFTISTSITTLRTGFLPRWIAFLGFACALTLLLVISDWPWIAMLFPAWTMVLSVYILVVRPISDTATFAAGSPRTNP